MIAKPDNCDWDRLSMMLTDKLTIQEQMNMTQHLDHCGKCRERLEHLAAEQSWWQDTKEALSGLSDSLADPVLPQLQAAHRVLPTAEGLAKQTSRPVAPLELADSDHWVLDLLSPSHDPDALGQVDSMPVHSVVGQGGMGVVLKAHDKSLHRFLAVKMLSPMLASSGAARQRFLREAQAAAAVVHPNIVPIYAVSTDRKLPYLVMPFVSGGNLQQHLDESGALPLDRTLSIGLQVAEGLSAAHRQGIVHRDIKPANLLFEDGGFRVMLTDFGLARALDDASLTASGMVAGTPQFMSPEQARGLAVDHRSDIYSLGAVLYALATGRPPTRGDSTLDVLRRIGEEVPTSVLDLNETYPAWFQRLVELLMAKEAAQRPQSADEVAELLRACLAHARRPQRATLPKRLQARTRWRSVGWASLMCLACFVAGGLVWRPGLLGNSAGSSDVSSAPASTQRERNATSPIAASETGDEHGSAPDSFPSPGAGQVQDWSAMEIEHMLTNVEEDLRWLQADLQLQND